jgi:taurine dioxygenase
LACTLRKGWQIRQAPLDYGVVFFRKQELCDGLRVEFRRANSRTVCSVKRARTPPVMQGNLAGTKHATCMWYHDTSFMSEPPTFTALRAVRPGKRVEA